MYVTLCNRRQVDEQVQSDLAVLLTDIGWTIRSLAWWLWCACLRSRLSMSCSLYKNLCLFEIALVCCAKYATLQTAFVGARLDSLNGVLSVWRSVVVFVTATCHGAFVVLLALKLDGNSILNWYAVRCWSVFLLFFFSVDC